MRLFTAIELPEPVRRHLSDVQASAKRVWEADRIRMWEADRSRTSPVSWTRVRSLHVTLKFLGEVSEVRLDQTREALRTIKLGPPPVTLVGEGIDAFPSQQDPRILVARMGGDMEGLKRLRDRIEDVCADLGFAREVRPFRPHVTFARAKRPIRAWAEIQQSTAAAFPGPQFNAVSFALFQSWLNLGGANYGMVGKFYPFE